MIDEKDIEMIATLLIIAGALNWGLVAYSDADAVKQIAQRTPYSAQVEYYVKLAIGAAGVFTLYRMTQYT